MQKALTSIALFSAPVVRSPAATPSSSIIVASPCAKAPFWFCSQLAKDDDGQGPNPPHDEPLSHEQGTGGVANPLTVSLEKGEDTPDFPLPLPVEDEGFVGGPAVEPIGSSTEERR